MRHLIVLVEPIQTRIVGVGVVALEKVQVADTELAITVDVTIKHVPVTTATDVLAVTK